MVASKDQVAQLIVTEARARKHTREECLGELSALYQESQWDETIWDPTHTTYGVAQQDGSYPRRFEGAAAQIKAFFDKLDVKRTSPAHGDIWLNICWLQQAPNWPSAQYWYDHGRRGYLDEIKSRIGTVTPYLDKYWPVDGSTAPVPVIPPQSYGMPTGSNSGGYGNNGVKFPSWVYDLGNAFGLKPSTYPGHQESERSNEAGYAPNPQHLNRGIDWAAPGAADEVDRMQRFADYLFSIKSELEQVIWWNPKTGKRVGVAGGRDVTNTPYYDYPGGYDDHRDHVHTRQSHPIPIPGGLGLPASASRPEFTELDFFSGKKVGQGFNVRSRPPINVFIHTEQGNSDAKGLARYCDGSNGVSYHDTVRDGVVCHVVNPDYYSWSVLSANVFSINICFAGSYAEWTREQWLAREHDIEIAAYLAVQYCRKYGIPTDVISPPYHEAAGISDHKYVTQQLHIGDHTDVGDRFPWDRFKAYVDKYANTATAPEEGFLMALSDAEQRELLNKVRTIEREQTQQHPSRSAVRKPGEGLVDTWAGMDLNDDGNTDLVATALRAWVKFPPAIERLKAVAQGGEPGRSPDDALLAQALLAEISKLWAKPAAAAAAVASPAAAAVSNGLDAAEILKLRDMITALKVENASLAARVTAAKAAEASTQLAAVTDLPNPSGEYVDTTGDKIARAVDANMDYTDHVLSLDGPQRAALTRALNSIDPVKNGSDS